MTAWRAGVVLFAISMAACGPAPSQQPPQRAAAPAPAAVAPRVVHTPSPVHVTLGASQVTLRDIASDENDRSQEADGEPSIAINPVNPSEISILAFSGNWGTAQGVPAPIWKSFDGGVSWEKLPLIPAPRKITMGPTRTVTLEGPADQSLTYDTSGRLVVAEMGTDVDDRRFNVTVLYQQKGGPRDPLTQMPAAFGEGFADQPIISSGAGTCVDRTYAAWLNTQKQLSMHSLAANDAISSLGVAETSELPTRTTRLAVSPSNVAYLLYKTRVPPEKGVESVSFRVRRSDDCGKSWNALGGALGVRVHSAPNVRSLYTNDFAGLQPLGLNYQPRAKSSDAWITVDGSTGDVYVAHLDVTTKGVSRVVMSRSTEKGRTWSSTDVTDGTAMSAYPEIAVNSEGVVGVLFIDYTGTGRNINFRHRLALSADKGMSWDFATLQTLSMRQLTNYKGVPELWGDFEGLTARNTTFYGVFTGASIGRRDMDLDPIFFTVDAHAVPAEPKGPPTAPPPPISVTPPLPPPPPSQSAPYTVVKGDSLWRIARKKSGKGRNWLALYDVNRNTVKRKGSLIHPGDVLRLPW